MNPFAICMSPSNILLETLNIFKNQLIFSIVIISHYTFRNNAIYFGINLYLRLRCKHHINKNEWSEIFDTILFRRKSQPSVYNIILIYNFKKTFKILLTFHGMLDIETSIEILMSH